MTALSPTPSPASNPTPAGASTWSPSSWRDFPIAQQPDWPNTTALETTLDGMRNLAPLVYPGETRTLLRSLAQVSQGRALLLQAGDCAESFDDFSADAIRRKLQVILQMAIVLTYSAGVPIVKVGRMAGQFAKPRSALTEQVGGLELPTFRGHIIHSEAPTLEARTPDPQRLVTAYEQSASTLNLIRSHAKGGFADLSQVHAWNQSFVKSSPEGTRYEQIATEIERSLRFMRACGIDVDRAGALREVDLWTSHEALLLGYEEALTRQDVITGEWYATSAAMLWIGERTRQLDGAHLEYAAGIANPVGCKVSASATPEEVVAICEKLNPNRIAGKLTLISRMGAGNVEAKLPALLQAVRESRIPVVWTCDPMHGNTFTSATGRKTRHFDAVLEEVRGFFAACQANGVWAGGLHCELTGEDVTECLGGAHALLDEHLDTNYATICDPRLNASQSLDLAFRVGELVRAS